MAYTELDVALPHQRQLRVCLTRELQDLLEATTRVGDKILVAQAKVPGGHLAPEGLDGGVPGIPEDGALRGGLPVHELALGAVGLALLLRPRVGRGPGISDQVQNPKVHAGHHAERVTVSWFLGGVDDHAAVRDRLDRPVQPASIVQELAETAPDFLPPALRQHHGNVAGTGAGVLQPHHLAGQLFALASELSIEDRAPELAFLRRIATAAEPVFDQGVLPDEVQLAPGEKALDLSQGVGQDRAAAPPESRDVEHLYRPCLTAALHSWFPFLKRLGRARCATFQKVPRNSLSVSEKPNNHSNPKNSTPRKPPSSIIVGTDTGTGRNPNIASSGKVIFNKYVTVAEMAPAVRGFSHIMLKGQYPSRHFTADIVPVFSTIIAVAIPMAAPRTSKRGMRMKLTTTPVMAATEVEIMAKFWFSVMASIRGAGPTEELKS